MGATDVLQYFTTESTGDAVSGGATAFSTYCLDMIRTTPQLGVGEKAAFLEIQTVVAAGSTGTITLKLQKSATASGGDLSGTITTILQTPAMTKGSDARIDTAGAWILRCTLPYECNQRYLQIESTSGTTATITYSARVTLGPPSDLRTQVMESNVGQP